MDAGRARPGETYSPEHVPGCTNLSWFNCPSICVDTPGATVSKTKKIIERLPWSPERHMRCVGPNRKLQNDYNWHWLRTVFFRVISQNLALKPFFFEDHYR